MESKIMQHVAVFWNTPEAAHFRTPGNPMLPHPPSETTAVIGFLVYRFLVLT
jgi:hypothetical protein